MSGSNTRHRMRWTCRICLALAATLLYSTTVLADRVGHGRGAEFNSLGDQINEAQRVGNLSLAEDLARQRLSVAEGGPARMLGNAYRNLGSILRLRGKFADAEIMLNKALPIIEKENDKNSYQAIRTLFNIGTLYTALSRYAEAETVLREAMNRQIMVDGEDQDAIQIYLALANVERTLGRFAEAETLLKSADATSGQPIAKDKAHRDEFALQRLRLQTDFQYGRLYYQLGRNAESADYARRSMAGFEKLEGTRHPDFSNAQTLLGLSLLRLGHLDEAETILRQAVVTSEQALGRDHKDTGRAVWGLAQTLIQNGKASEAEPLLKRAIDNQREAGSSSQLAMFERSYALFLARSRRIPEAIEHYRKSLDLIDRIFAQTRGLDDTTREGFVAQFTPFYSEALQLLLRLHRLHADAGYDREALAVVSRTQSRLFTEMLRKADAGKLSTDPAFIALRQRQENLKVKLNDLHRALTVTSREEPESNGEAITPRRAADPIVAERIAERRKQLSDEIAANDKELADVDRALWEKYPRFMELTQPRPMTVDMLQTKLLKPGEALLSYYLLPDRTLIFLVERDKFRLFETPHSRQEIAELVSAARRSEEAVGSSLGNLASLDPQVLFRLYQALFEPVEPYLKPGQRLLVVGDGPVHTLPLEMLISRWGDEEQRAFAAARASGKALLDEYATLPYLAQRFHFAYLPSLSSLASIRLYGKPPVSYDRELVSFADPVFEKPGYSTQTQTALATLSRSVHPSRQLVIPRLPETADEAREIAGILGGRSDVYLRERAQEHTVKSIDLKTTRYLHFATHGLLGGEFVAVREALAAAAEEDSGVSGQRNLSVMKSSDKGQATPETPASPQYDNVIDDEPRMPLAKDKGQPALLLSLSGDLQGEDGLLTMGEVIESLDINARLVVLSACNTAGENLVASSGEGFAGLTRAFMYAGAQGLLVSHWSVESRSTQELMTDLFRNLRQGEENLAALEHAREFIRNSNSGNPAQPVSRAHPYFWAPFVYVGD